MLLQFWDMFASCTFGRPFFAEVEAVLEFDHESILQGT